MREAATICPRPWKLTLDLLTLKVLSESRVTWAISVPILVFLGLCSRLMPDLRDRRRQTSDAHHRLTPPTQGRGIINEVTLTGNIARRNNSIRPSFCFVTARALSVPPVLFAYNHLRAKELMFSPVCLSVCLFVNRITQNNYHIFMKFYGIVEHNPGVIRLDSEWPWAKVKVTRAQNVKIVFFE